METRPNINDVFKQMLRDNKTNYLDMTNEIHALNYKYPLYIRGGNPIGIVLHNTSGLCELKNLVNTWKNKEPIPPPSHIAIDTTGRVGLYVRLEYADRAQATNTHLSAEFQAVENGTITSEQEDSCALFTAFAHIIYGVKMEIATSRTSGGMAHHSMFVDSTDPEGHSNCPGLAIIGKKEVILSKAAKLVSQLSFINEPAGKWEVRVAHWIWIYTFRPDGKVVWQDPFNKKSGEGTWSIDENSNTLNFKWKNSQSTESWNLPLVSKGQKGQTRMEGIDYIVNAERKLD